MALPSLTDAQCETLRELALRLPNEFEPIEPHELGKQLQFLAATLPSKNIDVETAQMRFAVYVRLLGGYSKEALAFMTERVCREHDWFPTPHQCLDILAQYNPPATRKDKALKLCANHTQAKFDEWLLALRKREPVDLDGKPERWLRIATEQGYLRCVDGEYEPR